MAEIDMSPKAVTTRLKRVSQLRRLGLLLKKAKPIRQTRSPSDNSSDSHNQSRSPQTRRRLQS